MKTLGIILIVAGMLLLIFRGFKVTREQEFVDMGPIELNKNEKDTYGWPVYVGAIVTVAGIVVLIAGYKKRV